MGGVIIVWVDGLGSVHAPPTTGTPILPAPIKTVRVFVGGELATAFPALHPTLVGVDPINTVVSTGVNPWDTVSIVIQVDCGDGSISRNPDGVPVAVGSAKL